MQTQSKLAVLVLAGVLAACATFSAQFDTFNKRLAGGYTTVTYARELAGDLLEARTITADDAENLNAQADHFRAALDIARTMHATDADAANARLMATLAGINALADYLRDRERLE